MSKSHRTSSVMSIRTFGLLSTLSLFSVGAFTSFLLLNQPDETRASRSDQGATDTSKIDRSRLAVNRQDRRESSNGSSQSTSVSAASSSASSAAPPERTEETSPSPSTSAPSESTTESPAEQQPAESATPRQSTPQSSADRPDNDGDSRQPGIFRSLLNLFG